MITTCFNRPREGALQSLLSATFTPWQSFTCMLAWVPLGDCLKKNFFFFFKFTDSKEKGGTGSGSKHSPCWSVPSWRFLERSKVLNNGSEQAEGSLETQETKLNDVVSYFLVLHDRAYILLAIGLKINYTRKNGLFPWVFLPCWAREFLYSWQIFFSH